MVIIEQQYHFIINDISIDSNDADKLETILCSNPPPIIIQIIKVVIFDFCVII